jgi:adenylate cyclase
LERKLTAILCADVHGYSRLMRDDEEATIRNLSAHRRTIDRLIEQHHGRFVNSAGDSVLAEFASAVNAVECAVEIQATLKAENADVPPDRRMEFRIGVNLGDVVVEGEQIYGDGVNVAARLESLAQPGSIYISASIHEQISNKLACGYEDLGEQYVKNIDRPIRVFRVLPNGTASMLRAKPRIPRGYWRGGVFSLAGLLIIAAVVVLVQHVSIKPPHTNASIPPAQSPALALPDKPSIAVLPFTNMSGDREQEYFSDGITDDLITDLSRLPGLFVIARNSTFTYKDKAAPLQQVGKELGVKYLLEGSVYKAAGQLRITVHLADATTGAELWAERYDRPMRDVFALQDEIVQRIVTTLNLQLALSQEGYLIPRSTESLEAYDDLLRGMKYLLNLTKSGNEKAGTMFEKAIERDPEYAWAYAVLGFNYLLGRALAFNPDPNGLQRALQLEQQAISLDDSLPLAHSVLAAIYVSIGQDHLAFTEAQRGIALDPNSAFGYFWLADVLNYERKSAAALVAVDKAMRLDPRNTDSYISEQASAYMSLARWNEVISASKRILMRFPDHLWAHACLADAYSFVGDDNDARAEVSEVMRTITRTPNSPVGYRVLAFVLTDQGKPAESLAAEEKAINLDPHDLDSALLGDLGLYNQGKANTLLRRWGESITAFKRLLSRYPDYSWDHAYMAIDYTELGQEDAARAEAAKVRRLDPQLTVDMIFPMVSLEHTALPAEIDRFRADLHKAGLK